MHFLDRPFLCGACVAAVCATGPAGAQVVGESRWTGSVTPYIWGAGLDGTIRPVRGGPSADVSQSFSDVLDQLDFGLFVAGYARRDRFVVFADIDYIALSDSGGAPPALAPVDRLEADLDAFWGTLLAGWRVVDDRQGYIDLMAGVRAWRIRGDVKAEVAGTTAARGEKTVRFADPLVAVRAQARVGERVAILGQADVGGGTGADSTWQVFGAVNYDMTERLVLSLGYRYLDVDYDDDGQTFDFHLDGPLVGLSWTF